MSSRSPDNECIRMQSSHLFEYMWFLGFAAYLDCCWSSIKLLHWIWRVVVIKKAAHHLNLSYNTKEVF